MSGMTPEQAQDDLEWAQALARNESGGGDWEDVCETLARAMATLAAMRVESDYRVVDPDTNGGKYETRRYERYITEWQEAPK